MPRGVHQTTKTTPKPPAKWYNRTALQVTMHRTEPHHTAPSLYINIFIF